MHPRPQTLIYATDVLRARLIPELISGRTAFDFATTEPDTSSDLTAERMRTVAEETTEGFVVNGRKRWITNSVVAGWVSVLVRAGAGSSRATMLLVDLSSPGVRIGVSRGRRPSTHNLKNHAGQSIVGIRAARRSIPGALRVRVVRTLGPVEPFRRPHRLAGDTNVGLAQNGHCGGNAHRCGDCLPGTCRVVHHQ